MDLILLQKMGDNISPFGLGFNPYFNGSNTSTWLEVTWIFCSLDVSILILMDLILLPDEELRNRFRKVGFNPYFNGSNTSTRKTDFQNKTPQYVSILILMDLILLQYFADSIKQTSTSFQSLF